MSRNAAILMLEGTPQTANRDGCASRETHSRTADFLAEHLG